jgi:class 3 adenylate cyclase
MVPEHIRTRFYEYNDHAQRHMHDTSLHGKESLPIADIHPTCTLMFADIVGYTTWSSNRQPEEIMKLLETLYGTFDNIAKKYDVFKVETVGDCYVAATGLPNVQDDHAVVLTIFASDCIGELKKVLEKLGNELGVDTANLSMRFGLHSGPVAAGILRGGNPRFQLFGDTVNTTARLETTGQPGRIHISQSTATFLIESGRADWVIERDALINMKGKGIMQTYWVDLLQVAPYIPVSRRYTI